MRRFAGIFLAILVACALWTTTARAGDSDDLRLLTGILMYPVASSRTEELGRLPVDGFAIPQPQALSIVGSVASWSNGKITAEAVLYMAPEGLRPDFDDFAAQLKAAGWRTLFPMMPLSIFSRANSSTSQTFCGGTGLPTITVQSVQRYLIVRAMSGPGICASFHRGVPLQSQGRKSPFPQFSAPEGSTFTNVSKETYYTNADVASTGLQSKSDAPSILEAFAGQMTAAGWVAGASTGASTNEGTFSERDKDGTSWVAVLTVVGIGNGTYIFTASAFKTTETQPAAANDPGR